MSSFLFIFLSIFLLSRAFGERAFCVHLDVVSVGGSLTLIVAWCLSWMGISQVICSWRHCLLWWLLSYCYRRAISLRSVPWLNRWTLSLSLCVPCCRASTQSSQWPALFLSPCFKYLLPWLKGLHSLSGPSSTSLQFLMASRRFHFYTGLSISVSDSRGGLWQAAIARSRLQHDS